MVYLPSQAPPLQPPPFLCNKLMTETLFLCPLSA